VPPEITAVDKVTRKLIRVTEKVVFSAHCVYRSRQGEVGKISDKEKLLRLGQRLTEQLGLVPVRAEGSAQ